MKFEFIFAINGKFHCYLQPSLYFMSKTKNISGSFSYLFLSILYYFGEFREKIREFWDIKYRVVWHVPHTLAKLPDARYAYRMFAV